jgi:hypothetical protein
MKILNSTKYGQWTLLPTGSESEQIVKKFIAQKPETVIKYLSFLATDESTKLQFALGQERLWIAGATNHDNEELFAMRAECINHSGGYLRIVGETSCDSQQAVIIGIVPDHVSAGDAD